MALANDERQRLESQFLNKTGGRERIATIRNEMQSTVEKSAGIYREQSLLSEGAAKLRDLQERYGDINLDDHSHTFNTELESALELGFMLDVARVDRAVRAASHGVAGSASAHGLSGQGRRKVSGAFVGLSQLRWLFAG